MTLTKLVWATSPNTGNRTLTYAFDDALTTARTPTESSTPFGNGNLLYTISPDASQGKHTARWEEYTSFNMTRQIKYGSIGSAANVPRAAVADRTLNYE